MTAIPPDALLLLAPGCVHCPVVLEGLGQLLKSGELGRLEAVNIAVHPEVATSLAVRGVPWVRIGLFELEGAHTPAELKSWAQHALRDTGFDEYYSQLLSTQRPGKVISLLRQKPDSLSQLLDLLTQSQTPMAVKIGIGVVLEELQGESLLIIALEPLQQLTRAPDAGLRADAAHYLGLTHARQALPVLQGLLHDDHPDVREIAAESIQLIEISQTQT